MAIISYLFIVIFRETTDKDGVIFANIVLTVTRIALTTT